MDRELLLEIGCEELPASWLPALTTQIGEVVVAQLREHRLPPEAPAETYSTPRRLTVRIGRLAERQADREELITGPPVSAAFKPDGTPTPAATGFAAKNGTEVSALERVDTPKGTYLAYRLKQRGKAAVDVLPDVVQGTLRGLSFPKFMQWDAMLEDGKGNLPFGRPIRWLLFTYGGRVVPFTISRTPGAAGGLVQDVSTGAATYGHRFLTTSGRAGRAIKVRSFDEYKTKLLENFVILERSERHNKIARELDAKAQRLQGRVSRTVRAESALLHEVPDLVEYPAVVAGTFAQEFLQLPEEVLTTTLIHHQHYFPVEGEDGRLKNAFLAVTNTEPDNERTIARNAERVVTARLRDAKFFWESDRKTTLESRLDRLDTLLFHKKLGSYRAKTERIEALARTIADRHLRLEPQAVDRAAQAARLSKVDLTTDMVREFTELQGKMGGIYAREEGLPDDVSKAIYFHYLPIAVEADAAPSKEQLGKAAAVWAAVSLADKLDTVAGLFNTGERPTGSRDPFGLRRAAQGVVKLLVDLEATAGVSSRPTLGALLRDAGLADQQADTAAFLMDRVRHLMQVRGLQHEEIQAATGDLSKVWHVSPADLLGRAAALGRARQSANFAAVAEAYKRANNIVDSESRGAKSAWGQHADRLSEPAELKLRDAVTRLGAHIDDALSKREPGKALAAIAAVQPELAAFFAEVRVMTDDASLQAARLSLLAELRDRIREVGDISGLAPKA